MLFNSLEFALFLPVVLLAWASAPAGGRRWVLLLASYVFYGWWKLEYALLLAATTTLDWWVVKRIEDASGPARRRAWLGVTLASNLGVLLVFKYWNLLNDSASGAAAALGAAWPVPASSLLLPIGVSFYTFQAIAYAVDVYRGRLKAERSWPTFALYVAYFPQLVAGPIERATTLIPQLHRLPGFDRERLASGLRLAAWGLFKKVVVADRLTGLVDAVYADPQGFSGFAYVVAAGFFAAQLYCDFSGYSDLAIGLSRVLGVELMTNFDHPQGSRSMGELWTRWHVSLSTWFRDYVYVPLGGNRVAAPRWALNVLIVFVLSGLWHGAEWKFALWGLIHGVLLVAERFSVGPRARLSTLLGLDRAPGLRLALSVAATQILWVATLVPFRAATAADAWHVYTHLGVGWTRVGDPVALAHFLNRVDVDPWMFAWCLALLPLVEAVDLLRRRPDWAAWWATRPTPVRWAADYAVVFAVLALGRWADTPFVYFQF